MNFKIIYILLVILYSSCRGQSSISLERQQDSFSITVDTLKCGNSNPVTQYIEYLNPKNIKIEHIINRNLIYLYKDIYILNNSFNLKEYNSKCCSNNFSCDFYIQEYEINYKSKNLASLSYKTYMYSFNPNNFNYINFNLINGEKLLIEDLFIEKGIQFLIKNVNDKTDNAIKVEVENLDEEELLSIKDLLEDKIIINKQFLNNFKIFEQNNQLYINFYYSFNSTTYQEQLLPVIDLTYSLKKLQPYLTEEFKKQLGIK